MTVLLKTSKERACTKLCHESGAGVASTSAFCASGYRQFSDANSRSRLTHILRYKTKRSQMIKESLNTNP